MTQAAQSQSQLPPQPGARIGQESVRAYGAPLAVSRTGYAALRADFGRANAETAHQSPVVAPASGAKRLTHSPPALQSP
jgi:hypothetical protein